MSIFVNGCSTPRENRSLHPLTRPLPTLLLSRPDRVGDVIIATSCLAALRAQLPDVRVVFAARAVMRPLLEGHPLLAGFLTLPPRATPAARQDFLAELGRWQADTVIHLHPDAFCQAAAQTAGIPRRIGYGHSLLQNRTLTELLPDPRRQGNRHEAEYNFDLLAPLGVRPPPLDTLRYSVHLADSWRESLRIRLASVGFDGFDEGSEPYAVLNPTAHALDLRWPTANFAFLAREFLKPGRFSRVVLVGDSLTDPSSRELRHRLGPEMDGLIDLTGQTNLAELGVLLRHAAILVTRNTGTAHLAAAVGCPTVELFGRLEGIYGPARWRALGDNVTIIPTPVTRRRWLEGKRTFWRRAHAAIPRELVLAAALKHPATRPKAPGASDDTEN